MAIHIGRRELIVALGGAAVWPLAARAQQGPMPVIGFLSNRSPGESAGVVSAFRRGLREMGFVEGRNLAIAFRWAEGRYERLPALAAELVELPVTLIFAAGGPPSAFAAQRQTSTIPIVRSAAVDVLSIWLKRMSAHSALPRPRGRGEPRCSRRSSAWSCCWRRPWPESHRCYACEAGFH